MGMVWKESGDGGEPEHDRHGNGRQNADEWMAWEAAERMDGGEPDLNRHWPAGNADLSGGAAGHRHNGNDSTELDGRANLQCGCRLPSERGCIHGAQCGRVGHGTAGLDYRA